MQCDEEKQEWTQGLLEKYVLGLCNATERKEVESLVQRNPKIGQHIEGMKNAMHCYCTSCHDKKVTSIVHSRRPDDMPLSGSGPAKLIPISCDPSAPGLIRRLMLRLKQIFSPPAKH
jgi:anti-sigma factor RsiW